MNDEKQGALLYRKIHLNLVLFSPEMPQNVGNIMRLCVNAGARLSIIGPVGFDLNDRRMKRTSLDYASSLSFQYYHQWAHFYLHHRPKQIFALTTKAQNNIWQCDFSANALDPIYLLFGSESKGLDHATRSLPCVLPVAIPMVTQSRSLNIANAASVAVYEVLRQCQ